MKILILNGPNLNLLGEREPEVYGTTTLSDLIGEVTLYAREHGVDVWAFQSNHEGELIDWLHDARHNFDGVVFNPGAYTHYSYALRDAIAGISIPVVEVHLSDIHAREGFRAISVIEPVAYAQISGLGVASYLRGIDALIEHNKENN